MPPAIVWFWIHLQQQLPSHCLDEQRSNNHYAVWPPRFLRSQKSKDPSGPHFSDWVLVLEKSLRDLTLSCSLPSPWLLHGSPTKPFVQLFARLTLCMLSSAREMRCPSHWECHLDPPCLSTALALPVSISSCFGKLLSRVPPTKIQPCGIKKALC